jgi:GrpB-like predicted nucleotidyltransferase (UPF0157 family)
MFAAADLFEGILQEFVDASYRSSRVDVLQARTAYTADRVKRQQAERVKRWLERHPGWRKAYLEKNRDKINAQKRAAAARRKECKAA